MAPHVPWPCREASFLDLMRSIFVRPLSFQTLPELPAASGMARVILKLSIALAFAAFAACAAAVLLP